MPRGKLLNGLVTQQKVLRAAVALFLEKGYTRTTTGEIAKAAGIGQSSFFHVFPSKEALLLELVKRMFSGQFALAGQHSGEQDPVLLYAVETALQLHIAELTEPLRELYVMAYSLPSIAAYLYKSTTKRLQVIFGPYLPEAQPKDFYEMEIASASIMRGFMSVPCDVYFTMDAKISRFLDCSLKLYDVPKEKRAAITAAVLQMDLHTIVLLIDNDPQGNLTAALGYTPGEQKNTLAKLVLVQIDSPEDLDLHLPRTVIHTETGIDLIPANKRLADAAARLQVMQLSQYNAAGFSDTLCEKIMEKLLVSLREQYDYIIIDCGLKHELLTINALAAADYCIIPVQAHFLASEGIPDVLEMVKNVQNRFNPDLKIAGILLTMYQSRPQLCQSVRNSVNDIYGESLHVFERPIEQTIKVAECPAAGMSILDYAPKNPAAESYRSLALEVLHLA